MRFILRFIFKYLMRTSVINNRDFSDLTNTIIVANHQSTIDAFLLYAFTNSKMKFVMKKSVGEKKIFSIRDMFKAKILKEFIINRISILIVKHIDVFRIEETSPHSLKDMIKELKNGSNIMVFPEGKITLDGTLGEIKEGMGLVASVSKSDILPVKISGFDTSIFGYTNGKKNNKALIYGIPFSTEGMNKKEITKMIKESIE